MQRFSKFFLTYCIAHITILRGGVGLPAFGSWFISLYSYAVIGCVCLSDLWGVLCY